MKLKLGIFWKILVPFAVTQALGIYAALRFLPNLGQSRPTQWSDFSYVDLIIFVALAACFIILIKRFKPAASIFFKVFLALIIFSGVQAVSGIWFGEVGSMLAALLAVAIFWFYNNVLWQDLIMIVTFAGIGAVIGLSFVPQTVIWFLVILSFYDIVAVYKTKHMVALAEGMIRSRAIFGFVIPASPAGLGERMSRIAPGDQFMILGSGDVILPLLLAASLVRISLPSSITVAIFSILGLFLMHLIFNNQKTRRPMAALPPIALLSIIGYLLVLIIF
ncbi:MAG: hypothetical protein HY506_02105 [Candidatus Yanofskybacteria bacterium]|nr:hypothetical protein [Candidatus Yanofskybacteria bacterium]